MAKYAKKKMIKKVEALHQNNIPRNTSKQFFCSIFNILNKTNQPKCLLEIIQVKVLFKTLSAIKDSI